MNMLKSNEQNERNPNTRIWTKKDKEDLIELYPYKTNKELCEILQKSEGQLRGMKERLGLNKKFNPFTDDEKIQIKEFYNNSLNEMDLDEFAERMGRQKSSISRYARGLNLTKSDRPLSQKAIYKMKKSLSEYRETEEYVNDLKKRQTYLLTYYAQNEHPRGMLNKCHSKETIDKMSISHIERFKNMTRQEKRDIAMKAVETKRKNGCFNTTSNSYSRCKGGLREDIGQYFRSSWEANVARLLNYLNIEWKYECKRFDFDKEKSGILSYQPDFYLPKYDRWVEVKGWMDEKSIKRLDLFKEYYPKESQSLILVDSKYYYWLDKRFRDVIDNWEFPNNYNKRVS